MMKYTESLIQRVKNIALVAHDNKKIDLIEWARWNKPVLQRHNIFATGTRAQEYCPPKKTSSYIMIALESRRESLLFETVHLHEGSH